MNQQKTHQINQMAPWDPLDALFDSLGPPCPPLNPPERSLGLIELLSSSQLPYQRTHQMSLLSYGTSNPSPLTP